MIVSLLAMAWAASALVVAPETPRPGVATVVHLAVWDGDAPVERIETVEVSQGELLAVSAVEPGVWAVSWVPAQAGVARFSVAGADSETVVAEAVRSQIEGPARISGQVGQALTMRFTGEDLPPVHEVQVAAPEGQVVSIAEADGDLVVVWRSDGDQRPRVVPVGIRDSRVPGAPPTWVRVSLGVRVPVTIRTEVGAEMVMEIGERRYGPVTADDQGVASVQVELRPGETSGQAVLTDALGNSRRSTVSLAPAARPVLAGLAEGSLLSGAPAPPVHLLALNSAGAPWGGDLPVCESVLGTLSVRKRGSGRYVATLPAGSDGSLLDLRVDCSLPRGGARTSVIVSVEQGLPSRLVLRAWPEEVSTDFPVAQVQAWIEDSRGDRLPPDGLQVRAEHGQIQDIVRDGLMLRAEYSGDITRPEDRVIAEWWMPPGSGQPRAIRLGATPFEDRLRVSARVVDRAGRPLPGLPVHLELAQASVELESDAQGWVEAEFPAPLSPERLVATSMGRRSELMLLPWLDPGVLVAGAADLYEDVPIHIRAGRVRKVSLGVDRPVLLTGGGDTAVITVLLLDGAGQPVNDEVVDITASAGFVSEAKVQADGSMFVVYQPPARMRMGTVEVTVSARDGSFPDTTITIDLVPEPVLRAPSVHGGMVSNFVGLGSPYVGLELEQALGFFPQRTNLRLGVGWYRDARTVGLDQTTIDLRMTVTPVTVSVHRRWSKGLWGTWAGGGLVLAPYRLQSWFDGDEALDAISIHRPGVSVYTGRGYRIRTGEIFGEIRYLGLGSRAPQYQGQVGGLVALAGIRIVY